MKPIVVLFLSYCFFGQSQNSDNQLLWEISGNGLKVKSYLFGSFHTNDKRVFNLGDSTYKALNSCSGIVLETDISSLFIELDTRNNDVKFLYDQNGNPYTSSKDPTFTLYGNEDGMPQFLDAHLQQFAYLNNKTFYPLESVEDQINLLKSDSEYMPSYAEVESQIISQEKILALYLKGDIYGLDKLMRISLGVYKNLYQRLIIDRNKIMTKGIDTLIQKEKLFIAVGAGHLAGDEGIINLLRKKGYQVRMMQHQESTSASPNRMEFYRSKTYKYSDDANGLVVQFPGKPLVFDKMNGDPIATHKMIYREMGQGNTYHIEMILKDALTLEGVAYDYIQSPRTTKIKFTTTESEVNYAEGLSDSYPEGLAWVRVIEGSNYFAIAKAYGGNKFMNSKRAQKFFNSIWLY